MKKKLQKTCQLLRNTFERWRRGKQASVRELAKLEVNPHLYQPILYGIENLNAFVDEFSREYL